MRVSRQNSWNDGAVVHTLWRYVVASRITHC